MTERFPFDAFEPAASSLLAFLYQFSRGSRSLQCRSALISGAPGCGKKSLIYSAVKTLGISLYRVDVMELLSLNNDLAPERCIIMLTDSIKVFDSNSYEKLSDLIHDKILNRGYCLIATNSQRELPPSISRIFDICITLVPKIPSEKLPGVIRYIFSSVSLPAGDNLDAICQGVPYISWENLFTAVLRFIADSKNLDLETFVTFLTKSNKYFESREVPRENTSIWSRIVGLDEQKKQLGKIIPTFESTQEVPEGFVRGALLYGIPGTGKTMFARALLEEGRCRFISVSIADWVHSEIGASQRAINQTFLEAKRLAPCVIFVDEIDTLFGGGLFKSTNKTFSQKGGAFDHFTIGYTGRSILTQLSEELGNLKPHDKVFFLAATNYIEKIPRSILRPKKIELLIKISQPTVLEISKFLESLKNLLSSSLNINDLAHDMKDYTIPDIQCILRCAFLKCKAGGKCLPGAEDIRQALKEKFEHLATSDIAEKS